ncbi:MAG: hypothetical protein RIM72_23475, partial [Alphaproteobacteria bacterium]
AVADTPSLEVSAATGAEDTAIALDITSALSDASESLAIEIANIPDGATLTNSAGDTITITDGSATLTADQLDGLAITPPANDADDFNLTVTATSTDGSDTASQSATLAVSVTGVADIASLETNAATGDEDTAIPLDISVTGIQDGDAAEVSIQNIPDGATLTNSAGDTITVTDGTATLTPDQLDGLAITPPANADDDFNLTVAVTTTDADSGDTATVTDTLAVSVDAVADTPSLEVSAATGAEDTAIALDITSALSDASESLAIEIANIPDGA